ncbi:LytR/AlgR family response regulator transcription factor [Fulvivirga ligni]|uniref:LytR/AlgR family response regulator transcription factor n=1 Tax=Fulvivirga ligni TaxID=2904246 RepID=UPI001F2958FE|nr:response regulator [Fulvivirga ligni]UII23044.1 response regulator [Fulvivirga ligni]
MKSNLNLIVVEDDPIIAEDIRETLIHLGHHVVDCVYNAEQCLALLKCSKVDMLIMDVDLGRDEMDGISLARKVKQEYGYPFIFLTSYYDDDTLKRAADTQPRAYVLKPFVEKDLKVALEVSMARNAISRNVTTGHSYENDRLFAKDHGVLQAIAIKDIIYFNSCDNYCYIFVKGAKYMVLHRLKDFLDLYGHYGFRQVHRSFVVNLHHLDQITEDYVHLNDYKVPIGKSYKKDFLNSLTVV